MAPVRLNDSMQESSWAVWMDNPLKRVQSIRLNMVNRLERPAKVELAAYKGTTGSEVLKTRLVSENEEDCGLNV